MPGAKTLLFAGVAVIGLLLLILPGLMPEKEEPKDETETETVTYYTEKLEKKLSELVSSAVGTENARVVVTLDRTQEYVYAKNESKSNSQSAAEYVIISGGSAEEPILVTEIYPKVRGVAVVCAGGDNAAVRERVTELICAALGISANKIAVSGQS